MLTQARLSSFSVHDVCVGWVEALRELGHWVTVFNLDDRLTFYDQVLMPHGGEDSVFRKALSGKQAVEFAMNGLPAHAYRFWPDVVLVVSSFFVTTDMLDLLRSRGHKVVIVHTESPYEDSRQLRVAEHADLNLINDPTNLEVFRSVGPAAYVPHAYRPSVHCPGEAKPDLVCDLGFVGTGYASRINFFEAMDLDGIEVRLAGNWKQLDENSPLRRHAPADLEECLDNTDAVDLYRSARVGINFYRREAEAEHLAAGWAMGPREVEMAATGLFFLRDPRPESDQVLGVLPAFATAEDAAEQLRWWLAHEDERQVLAAKARDAVADRTFVRNARELLRLLDA